MFSPQNEHMLQQAQDYVDAQWDRLLKESAAGEAEKAE
jgi:hypothetical protein